jgi:hypothetical protein
LRCLLLALLEGLVLRPFGAQSSEGSQDNVVFPQLGSRVLSLGLSLSVVDEDLVLATGLDLNLVLPLREESELSNAKLGQQNRNINGRHTGQTIRLQPNSRSDFGFASIVAIIWMLTSWVSQVLVPYETKRTSFQDP